MGRGNFNWLAAAWRFLRPRQLVMIAMVFVLSIILSVLFWEVLLLGVSPRPAVMARIDIARAITAGILIVMFVGWHALRVYRMPPSKPRSRSESSGASAIDLTLAEERERRRIAIGLHDDIGQTLALAKMRLGKIESLTEDRTRSSHLSEVRGLLDRTIQKCRSLSFDLSSPVLHELGLEAALQSLGKQLEHSKAIRFHFHRCGTSLPIPEKLAIVVYRSARELLRNVARHSRATNAWMSFAFESGALRLELADDGVGMEETTLNGPSRNGGFGIYSMAEQLRDIGGSFEILSSPTPGARIVMTVPLGALGNAEVMEASGELVGRR